MLLGLAIKKALEEHGELSLYQIYKEVRKIRPSTTYKSVSNYVYALVKLGLVERSRVEMAKPLGRSYYRLTGREAGREVWVNPTRLPQEGRTI